MKHWFPFLNPVYKIWTKAVKFNLKNEISPNFPKVFAKLTLCFAEGAEFFQPGRVHYRPTRGKQPPSFKSQTIASSSLFTVLRTRNKFLIIPALESRIDCLLVRV
jgi:hypothetical protein